MTAFFWGVVGGFLAQFAAAYAGSKKEPGKGRKKSTRAALAQPWLWAVGWAIAGGVVAFAHGEYSALSIWAAIQLGTSTPLILGQITSHVPKSGVGTVE